MQGVSFPYGPVNDMEQVFSDAQVRHNEMVRTVEHSSLGPVSVVAPAVRYSHSVNEVRGPPPTLGQHTETIVKVLSSYHHQSSHNHAFSHWDTQRRKWQTFIKRVSFLD